MKIAALLLDGQYRQALVREDRLHPLPAGTDLFELLAAKLGEDEVLSRCAAPLALAGQDLLPPVRPASIRDFITFEQHVEGSFKGSRDPAVVPEWYEIPTFYFTNPHALIGPRDDVPVPPGCAVFDFELEVAAIIGVDGHNLPVEEAEGHIAGYSIFNDWSPLAGASHSANHLVSAEWLSHSGSLHDSQYRFFHSGKSSIALGARTSTPNYLPLVHFARVNNPRIGMPTARATHPFSPFFQAT